MKSIYEYEYCGIKNYFEVLDIMLGVNRVYRINSQWSDLHMEYITTIKDFSYENIMNLILNDIEGYENYIARDGKGVVALRSRTSKGMI